MQKAQYAIKIGICQDKIQLEKYHWTAKELLKIIEEYSGEIAENREKKNREKKKMLRKLAVCMLELPGFRKIILLFMGWPGKGEEDGSSESVLIFRIFPPYMKEMK